MFPAHAPVFAANNTVCKTNPPVKKTLDAVVGLFSPVVYLLHGQTSRFTIWANLV